MKIPGRSGDFFMYQFILIDPFIFTYPFILFGTMPFYIELSVLLN